MEPETDPWAPFADLEPGVLADLRTVGAILDAVPTVQEYPSSRGTLYRMSFPTIGGLESSTRNGAAMTLARVAERKLQDRLSPLLNLEDLREAVRRDVERAEAVVQRAIAERDATVGAVPRRIAAIEEARERELAVPVVARYLAHLRAHPPTDPLVVKWLATIDNRGA